MSLLIQIFVVKSGLVRYQITENWKLDKSFDLLEYEGDMNGKDFT